MAWTWPRIERRGALIWLAAIVAFGLWQGNTVWFAMQADGSGTPWSRPYLWELTGALAGYAVSWIPLATATNAPRPAGRWSRFLAIHAAGYLAFTALHTGLMLGVRFPLYRALGWGPYDYGGGSTAFRLAMEASKDVVAYLLLAGGFGLFAAWRDGQRRALRDARIATELRDAQLRALVGQLNPHFLFNALNTISAVMYSDLARTDRLLADLGDMLRAGLTGDAGPTWSLTDERAHTERFLSVMLARFGDRLQVRWPGGGSHLIRESLVELEPRLDPARFVRVHRGEIIQLDAVVRFDALSHGDAVAELDDGSSVIVSRTHRDTFLARWRGR